MKISIRTKNSPEKWEEFKNSGRKQIEEKEDNKDINHLVALYQGWNQKGMKMSGIILPG